MNSRRCLSGIFFLLSLPSSSLATTADFFGIGSRPIAVGNAYTAVSNDPSSLYYNPAGLVMIGGHYVGTGYFHGESFLNHGGKKIDMYKEQMVLIHAAWGFGGTQKDKVSIGLSLFMPLGSIYKLRVRNPEEPFFVMYENNVQTFQLRLGAAGRPLPWVAVGGSVMLLASLDGTLNLFTPFQPVYLLSANDRLIITMDQDLPNKAYYSGGLLVDLGRLVDWGKGWTLGFAYRGENYVRLHLGVDFRTIVGIWRNSKGELIGLDLPVIGDTVVESKYAPQRFSLGIAHQGKRLLLSADVDYILYEKYKLPSASLTLNLEQLVPFLTLLQPRLPRVHLRNVFCPKAGMEYKITEWLYVRAGYRFEPTPIKEVDLPVIDTDKHVFSAGIGLSFKDLLKGAIPGITTVNMTFLTVMFQDREIMGRKAHGKVVGGMVDVGILLKKLKEMPPQGSSRD